MCGLNKCVTSRAPRSLKTPCAAAASTHAALQALLGKIITRILRRLTRLGHLVEEDGQTTLAVGHHRSG